MIKQRINSKITTKIGLLVSIQATFIVGSVIILSYFESQGTLLGNSVNIAGKNRFLTSSVLLQTEEYFSGSSNVSAVNAAMNNLQSTPFASLLSLSPTGSLSTGNAAAAKKESQTMASEIINLSNSLTADLGNDVKSNSQN